MKLKEHSGALEKCVIISVGTIQYNTFYNVILSLTRNDGTLMRSDSYYITHPTPSNSEAERVRKRNVSFNATNQ